MRWLIPLCVLAGPALAACPAAPDHAADQQRILAELRLAENAGSARGLSDQLWDLWTDAPDDFAQNLLDTGRMQLASRDLDGARITLGKLVDYCPDYAEGYNQRAFAAYLSQDFAAALVDLDRALALNPGHLAALSGKGLTLLGLGRKDEGQQVLREAVRMNPFLSERALIEGPVETDI